MTTTDAPIDWFRNTAPTTAAEAATIILDGVRAGQWRILVGEDARRRADRAADHSPGPDGAANDGAANCAGRGADAGAGQRPLPIGHAAGGNGENGGGEAHHCPPT